MGALPRRPPRRAGLRHVCPTVALRPLPAAPIGERGHGFLPRVPPRQGGPVAGRSRKVSVPFTPAPRVRSRSRAEEMIAHGEQCGAGVPACVCVFAPFVETSLS
ncbi:hypothetical protein Nans01_19980 [Nocardiopsis ansamitocini]|uniref:Uncharacterized protein n=1 Tax=Nocardiopsis ansamitocini TaxID=1670832 RepID=A0A9W6P5X7_9ACTN|nr:hypothetical protein Nans01_19980 [Nocardiopsis ansamitocini]